MPRTTRAPEELLADMVSQLTALRLEISEKRGALEGRRASRESSRPIAVGGDAVVGQVLNALDPFWTRVIAAEPE